MSLPLRVSPPSFAARKGQTPLVMVTAYDAPQGRLADAAGADALLVGDSLAMVTLGYDSTLPVTLDDMVRHTQAVVRGQAARKRTKQPSEAETARQARMALIVADLPFGSYGATVEGGVKAGMRLVSEGGARAVKLEGAGTVMLDTVRRLVEVGVPVMGHLGMTPQSFHKFGGFKMQGKSQNEADKMLNDAVALVEAGVFGIVLEVIPFALTARITEAIPVPTIGIGAGPHCDGQVQVLHDLLGLSLGQVKHARPYADVGADIERAVSAYAADVRTNRFVVEE